MLGQPRRPAATSTIIPLAWEPPYAVGTALKKKTEDRKKKKKGRGNLDTDAEGRQREDTERRWPSTSHGERAQKEANLPTISDFLPPGL